MILIIVYIILISVQTWKSVAVYVYTLTKEEYVPTKRRQISSKSDTTRQ
jgi:hypothetical protein